MKMPRGDGTGPLGWGPSMGWGMGYCRPWRYPGFRRRLFGRGFFPGYPGPYGLPAMAGDKEFLKDHMEYLKDELKAVEAMLKELEDEKD